MGLIHDLLSRRKEIPLDKIKTVDQLFSELEIEIKEETELFRGFLWWQEKKIESIKKIVPAWEKGDMETIEKSVKEISARNQRLWSITNEILRIDQKEEQLFHFILREKLLQADSRHLVWKNREDILNKKRYEQYAKSLEPYFEQLFDLIRSLLRLLYLQITTIKKWGKSAAWRLERDLAERKFFCQLLVDEASITRKIKQHIVLIIRTVNQLLGYRKQFGIREKTIQTEKGPRKIISWGIIWHEVKDIKSINFEKFYQLYIETFPEDEQEYKKDLKRYINYLALKLNIKEGATRTHLCVGIANGEVIAYSFFGTYFAFDPKTKRKFFFGVNWWDETAKEYRGKRVMDSLNNFRTKIMLQDAKQFGVKGLDAIFIEVEDPHKLKEQKGELPEAEMNVLVQRIKFWQRQGFFQMKFDYIQPALKGKPIDYLMLMIRSSKKEWIKKQGIPLNDMKLIFWFYVRYGFDRVPQRDSNYWQNLKNMDKSQIRGYIKFVSYNFSQ